MRADNWQNHIYIFACDLGVSFETIKVINEFKFQGKFKISPEHHRFSSGKQSYNVMNGLLSSYNRNSDLVFYIEDDVFIGKDFFTFHEEIHKKANPFVSIVSKNMNSTTTEIFKEDSNAYYVKHSNEYQGIGSCFNKELLFRYLKPHFTPNYFSDLTRYVQNTFPESKLNANYAEQDGLIRRIIEKNNLPVCFAHVPRCFHAGFYGYHRTPKINMRVMKLKQRCDYIRKVAFNERELLKVIGDPYFIKDSMPVNLNTEHHGCYELPC